MIYEELREVLNKIYYEDSPSFTPEVMNALSRVIWMAEEYEKAVNGATIPTTLPPEYGPE